MLGGFVGGFRIRDDAETERAAHSTWQVGRQVETLHHFSITDGLIVECEFKKLMGVIALSAVAGDGSAAMVTVAGDTVRFKFDDSVVTSFGQRFDVSVTGDELVFVPREGQFESEAKGKGDEDSAIQLFSVRVLAKKDYELSDLVVSGGGQYEKVLTESESEARISYKYRLPTIGAGRANMETSYLLDGSKSGGEGQQIGNWIAEDQIDPNGSRRARFNLTSRLFASVTSDEASAFINQGAGLRFQVNTSPTAAVPLPATIGLLFSGLWGVIRWASRGRNR